MDNGRNLIKISIIKFDTNATLVCENILPTQYSSLDITFSGGGTDFEPVFKLAAQISNKYIKQAKIIFIFMTDGQSG
jgi:Mg-chelatase subunit ChlD